MPLFLFLFFLMIQKPNYCSCNALGPIDDIQYNRYSLIVKGKVVKITMDNFERSIYLAVDTYYKGGEKQATITIISPGQEGECGIIPKIGETWLMFANTNANKYQTDLCTRTKNMNPKVWDYNKDELADDIKFLEAKMAFDSR